MWSMKWVENHEDSRFKSRQRQNIGELFPSVLALMDKVTFIPIADGRFRYVELVEVRASCPGHHGYRKEKEKRGGLVHRSAGQ